nr:vitamin B12-dependent ribonucleotide reductase [Acidimicrobiia bacterium]
HAIRIWTMVLEISVTMAHFPSKEIAQGSFDYRTLGLGYANLGSLLMRMGIAYDSEEGRAIAGALTAILTGYAYATSAEMAKALGPFKKYEMNADAMLRVMRNHRRAAYNAPINEYDGVSTKTMGIDPDFAPLDMLAEARKAWDTAVELGEKHGYRNAQATVLAPTGTIGLLMDCDTTGVEPDFALVKFKKLAGGGYFKIANQSIAPALKRLGYSDTTIEQILDYVVGTMSLTRAPHINTATLIAKGFTADDIQKIESVLPGVFELGFAFNQWTLGEDVMQRLGFTPEQYTDPGFNMLRALGFSDSEIVEANDYVCGHQTIEGAPHLREEHLAVFDCANRNGKYGERFIHHAGHIKMMAAAQPFISGAISKTINMPNEVTIEDIEESYRLSWELGLKAMALYRDGSKASQPLSAKSDDGVSDEEPEDLAEALEDEIELVTLGHTMVHGGMFQPGVSPAAAYADLPRPRFLLPSRRNGYTQEGRVGGHKVFIRTGEYDDGTLGELFIDLAKEGATLRGILSCFAIAVSKGLQYGVPLEEFVDTFTFQTFEPRGMVEGHPNIKMANSIIDYVFRALGVEYLHRDELAQVPPDRTLELPEPPKGIAVDAGLQLDLTDAAMERDIAAQAEAATFVDTNAGQSAATVATVADVAGNGSHVSPSGSAAPAPVSATATAPASAHTATDIQSAAVQAVLADKMGDAPLCDTCGHITVRNGSCYRCLNCGDSKGCS